MRSRRLNLVTFGRGNVGRAFLRQIAASSWPIGDITLVTVAVADADALYMKVDGFDAASLRELAEGLVPPDAEKIVPCPAWDQVAELVGKKVSGPCVAVDVTAAPSGPAHAAMLGRGWAVVTANKKPTSGAMETFRGLVGNRLYFRETTVGAGLPVLCVMKEMLETGDEILEIRAAASGTLGFICSACEDGLGFAEAVLKAKQFGFTEPDPRDDLSGLDVARKALILARSVGSVAELADISIESMIPAGLESGDAASFLARLPDAAAELDGRFAAAKREGRKLRYLLSASKEKIAAGLSAEPADSPFSALSGPENMFVIRSRRYDAVPLVVRGPGAGAEVTAAGAFGDVLRAAREF